MTEPASHKPLGTPGSPKPNPTNPRRSPFETPRKVLDDGAPTEVEMMREVPSTPGFVDKENEGNITTERTVDKQEEGASRRQIFASHYTPFKETNNRVTISQDTTASMLEAVNHDTAADTTKEDVHDKPREDIVRDDLPDITASVSVDILNDDNEEDVNDPKDDDPDDICQMLTPVTTDVVVKPETPLITARSDTQIAAPATPEPSQFVWDRKSLTVLLGTGVAAIAVLCTLVAVGLGLVALVTSPLWLPVAVLTCPVWVPLLFFTSPVWGTTLLLVGGTVLFATALGVSIIIFFVWPADWLPESDVSSWLLQRRDDATLALVKLQVKLVLYSAGVGPLADVALMITDRIDFVALQTQLQDFDFSTWYSQVKEMDLAQLQATILSAVRHLARF